MSYVIVTIELSPTKRLDLSLPVNVPLQRLSSAIAQATGLEVTENVPYDLLIKTQDGNFPLSPFTTLNESGVLNGCFLQLQKAKNVNIIPINSPSYLVSENGDIHPLTSDLVMIGRRDIKRGIYVDIDLTPFDSHKITSRRHAKIVLDNGIHYLSDLDSQNGLWKNDKRLLPGERQKLNDDDTILFGRNGVIFTYYSGKKHKDIEN